MGKCVTIVNKALVQAMTVDVEFVEVMRSDVVQWISPADAIEYIGRAADCDRASAIAQMRTAIAGGDLGVRWADAEDEDDKPQINNFWEQASFRLDHGGEVLHQAIKRTICKAGESYTRVYDRGFPRFRPFFVSRDDLVACWPAQQVAPRPLSANESVRCSTPEEIEACARKIYRDRAGDPPNMDEAERLIKQGLPRAKRDTVRAVLRKPEFASQRRRSGQRRKR